MSELNEIRSGRDARFLELDKLIEAQNRAGIKDDGEEIKPAARPSSHHRMQEVDETPVNDQQRKRILELRAEHYRPEEIAVQVGCRLKQVKTVFRQAGRAECEQRAKE